MAHQLRKNTNTVERTQTKAESSVHTQKLPLGNIFFRLQPYLYVTMVMLFIYMHHIYTLDVVCRKVLGFTSGDGFRIHCVYR